MLAKLSAQRLGHWPSVLIYTLISAATTLTVFTVTGKTLRDMDGTGALQAAAAGILGGLAAVFFQKALSDGPVSTTTALSALYPIIAVIFGAVFLRERLTPLNYVGIALALAAGILISL